MGAARRQSNLDAAHLADAPVAHELASAPEILQRALPASRLPDSGVPLLRVRHGAAFHQAVRDRLFAVDVQAGVQSGDGGDRVPVVRRRQGERVDVLARKQLAEVGIGLAACIAVALIDAALGGHQMVPIHVAHGDDLRV